MHVCRVYQHMLTAKTGPHTESYPGLHVHDPRGRHVANKYMNG